MIEVELQGDKRLIAKLVAGPYLASVHRLVLRLALRGERYAREGVVKDTAGLANSIESSAKGLNGRVFSRAAHALPVEFGRKPGKMPPPKALLGWVRRHTGAFSIRTRRRLGGRNQAAEDRSVAFLIARAIGRRGTKGRFFFRKAHQRMRNELPTLIRQTQREIERLWGRP